MRVLIVSNRLPVTVFDEDGELVTVDVPAGARRFDEIKVGDKVTARYYDNVTVRVGDGYKGWPEKAPFDAIVVTAAPAEIPQALVDQLAEGGSMVLPVGTAFQELMLVEKKKGGEITKRVITAVRFVPMVKGKETEKKE